MHVRVYASVGVMGDACMNVCMNVHAEHILDFQSCTALHICACVCVYACVCVRVCLFVCLLAGGTDPGKSQDQPMQQLRGSRNV